MHQLPVDRPNPWKTTSTRQVYDNPWIEVSHREVITPTGTDGIYGHVRFKNLAVGVIPIDDHDHTWLVGQYRYAIDRYTWEIPEGGCPIGTNPADTARRELIEECGLDCGNVELLAECDLSNSVTDEMAFIYTATDLSPTATDPDDTEEIEIMRLPIDEAIAHVLDGSITDALSMIGLLRLHSARLTATSG